MVTKGKPEEGSIKEGLALVVLTPARARKGSRSIRFCVRHVYGNDWFSLGLMGRFVLGTKRSAATRRGAPLRTIVLGVVPEVWVSIGVHARDISGEESGYTLQGRHHGTM